MRQTLQTTDLSYPLHQITAEFAVRQQSLSIRSVTPVFIDLQRIHGLAETLSDPEFYGVIRNGPVYTDEREGNEIMKGLHLFSSSLFQISLKEPILRGLP